jgi:hypothetical protein
MSEELRDLISQAAVELNPEMDNQEAVDELDTDPLAEDEDDLVEAYVENEDESEAEVEDETEEESTDGEKYTVKVDGEKFEVTLEELKAGYQRQSDYTRDKQALKAEIEQVESFKEQYAEQFTAIEELDSAWEENPVRVLSHFASNTENPTQAVAELIRDLAADNKLDSQFLAIFGITPEIQNEWRKESELNQLRTVSQKTDTRREKELQDTQMELEVQKAIAEYDRQIDDIIDNEGFEFNTKQRTAFRQDLAKYAAENELTNLKTAYKAFKFDENQRNKKLAAKTVEKAKAKKATNVVSRSSSGEGTPMQDNSDLSSVIRAALKEATGN